MDGLRLFCEAARATGEPMARWPLLDRHRLMELLNQRARMFVKHACCRTELWNAESVAGEAVYPLPPGFLGMADKTRAGRGLVVLEEDGVRSMSQETVHSALDVARATDPEGMPAGFVVEPYATGAAVTGVAEADGVESGGRSPLVVSGGFSAILPGDAVHNLTRSAFGVVLAGGTADQVPTAMGPVGVDSWQTGDHFRILPAARQSLRFTTPFAGAGVLLTARIYAAPAPIYSDACVLDLEEEDSRVLAWMAAADYAAEHPGVTVDAERAAAAFTAQVNVHRMRRARTRLHARGG